MKRGVMVLLSVLALVTGEAGVLLKHLPVVSAVGVVMICDVVGCLSWWLGGGTRQPADDAQYAQYIEEMHGVCPWMTMHDVLLLRRAFASLERGWSSEDVLMIADAAWQLHHRALMCGDERRAWVFWQRYKEVYAWQQGQEYHWPALPQEVEERGPIH